MDAITLASTWALAGRDVSRNCQIQPSLRSGEMRCALPVSAPLNVAPRPASGAHLPLRPLALFQGGQPQLQLIHPVPQDL